MQTSRAHSTCRNKSSIKFWLVKQNRRLIITNTCSLFLFFMLFMHISKMVFRAHSTYSNITSLEFHWLGRTASKLNRTDRLPSNNSQSSNNNQICSFCEELWHIVHVNIFLDVEVGTINTFQKSLSLLRQSEKSTIAYFSTFPTTFINTCTCTFICTWFTTGLCPF